MNLSTKMPLIALATLALAGAAIAQPPPGGTGPGRGHGGPFSLLAMDANADGKLTRAEFDAGQRARFAEIDANKDGSATPEEFKKFHEAKGAEMRAELSKARFETLDKDKNGQLSQAELAAGPGKDGWGGQRGEHRHHGKDRGEHGKRGGDDAKPVSFTEFSARGVEAFTRADANKDGTITVAELQALKTGNP